MINDNVNQNKFGLRRNVKIPLLDIPDVIPDDENNFPLVVVPLPSDHLPDALRDLSVYGMELKRPIHKLIVQDAISRRSGMGIGSADAMMGGDSSSKPPFYGHVAIKPSATSLVGAIGCTAEILLQASGNADAALMGGSMDGNTNLETAAQAQSEMDLPQTVVTCGGWRFVVKEIVQTVPFPVAIVDELPDSSSEGGGDKAAASNPTSTISSTEKSASKPATSPSDDTAKPSDTEDGIIEYNDFEDFEVGALNDGKDGKHGHDGGDDDEDDLYTDMEPSDIMRELFQTIQAYVDQTVEEAGNQEMSPLEQAILEDTGLLTTNPNSNINNPLAIQQARAEQMAATWIGFRTSLIDFCVTPRERYFAVSFMAAEIMDLPNAVRRKMLRLTNSIARLKYVLQQAKETAGMARARRMANAITDQQDESSKDLQVGTPELPPWSKQLRKGMKISYYWNEEWEWCDGEVVEDPVMIVDELLVTVKFESDGEIHKLPFRPDEKARWRPAGLN